MRAGQLRSQVVIEQRGTVRDDWGQTVEAWVPFATVRADIRFPSGMGLITTERVEGGREVSVVQCSVRVRWRNGITAGMRARVQVAGSPMLFDIKQVVPDLAYRKHIDLVCATGAKE